MYPVKGDTSEKEPPPAAPVKKQLPVQENAAAVQPVKAATVEVRVKWRDETFFFNSFMQLLFTG